MNGTGSGGAAWARGAASRWRLAVGADAAAVTQATGLGDDAGEMIAEAAAALTAGDAALLHLPAEKGSVRAVLMVDEGLIHLMTGGSAGVRPGEGSGLERLVLVYSALARSRDATVITDPAGWLLAASPAWRAIYGFRLRDVLGRNPRVVNARQHPPAFFEAMWRDLLDPAAGTWSGEIVNRRASGELVHVWQTITAIRGPSGSLAGYLGITRDMTAHTGLRDRLLRANRELERLARFKSDLMAIAAHDLRSPLQGLLAHAELIEQAADLGDLASVRRFAQKSREIGAGMARLVTNVLDLQSAEAGRMRLEPARGNLRDALRSCVEMQRAVAARRGTSLVFESEGAAIPSFFDAQKIDQAAGNLLANALKFTPPGGRIEVRHCCATGGHVVRFDDSGCGIPEEDRERVFERHYRTEAGRLAARQAGGDGWGLAVAAEIVKLHGGRIRAGDSPFGGCRIEMEIPYGYGERFRERIWAVLIYDPSETVCGRLAAWIQRRGTPAFVAATVADSARICSAELPNLVIMTAGLDGLSSLPPFVSPDDGQTPLKPVFRRVAAGPGGALIFAKFHEASDDSLEQAADALLESAKCQE